VSGRAGNSGARRAPRPDRTKYRATPGRGAARGPAKRRLPPVVAVLLSALFALTGIALGVGVLVGGASAAVGIRTEHHQPELRMTISDCRTTGRSRSPVHHCRGTGDPGDSGVTTGTWYLNGSSDSYRPGAAVAVRCDSGGSCHGLGVLDHLVTVVLLLGGLFLTGAGAVGPAAVLLRTFAPARAAALRRPRIVRAGTIAAVAVLVLAVAAPLLYMLT